MDDIDDDGPTPLANLVMAVAIVALCLFPVLLGIITWL